MVQVLDRVSLGALYAVLLWAPLASGAHRGWSLALAQLLTLLGLLLWVLRMIAARRLEWRRTALDLPMALLVLLVLLQLAMGNRPLAAWALAPPAPDPELPVDLPIPLFSLGTVSPVQTARSLLLFLTYAGVYFLVVNLVRRRDQMERLVQVLLALGTLLAFLGLLDYLTAEAWLIRWREEGVAGRLSGTFVNPDHFAAWLVMLVCLGLGYLAGRSPRSERDLSLRSLLASRQGREQAVRRYLPFIGVCVMVLALVFTLSRGGVLSLLVALVAFLALLGAHARARWSLVVVGALLAVALGAGVWIGLAPLLDRVWQANYASRWIQSLTSLPMLRAFPLLGVGFGAYKDIYFRFQPPELQPGKVYFPYAHNDLLQIAVELGLIGTALALFAAWRVGRDLLGAHLLGRGGCPVGGGEGEGARRSDPFSVGLAAGALAALLALCLHSAFDFGARIPANGILAAACLGVATVAVHTRFSGGGERLLTGVRVRWLGRGKPFVVAGVAVALVLSLTFVPLIVLPTLAEAKFQEARRQVARKSVALALVEEALALDPFSVRGLRGRAQLRLDAAGRVWNSGVAPGGQLLDSPDDRRREALSLITGAVRDLRTAISLTPSDPFLHERLAWVHGTAVLIDPSRRSPDLGLALTHLHRAIALAPTNPFLHRSLAALAVTQGDALLPVGLRAGRDAVERDSGLLPDLVDRFLPLSLSEAQWVSLVPDSALDRLELASVLADRGLLREAASVYRHAAELASPGEEPVFRWMLARLLMRLGDHRGAALELDIALRHDSENPELHLMRALALAGLGDPDALEAYRLAVLKAEARARQPAHDDSPFRAASVRARALVAERLGQGRRTPVVRYRSALAQYLTERKLWQPALQEWDAVLVEAPLDPLAHFSRGLALEALGDGLGALEAYRRAVALDGRSARFRLRFAQRLWETGQYYQAINEWRAVTAQEPGSVEARLALARAYAKVGERIQAVREYQHVLMIEPNHAEARLGLARLGVVP